MTEEIDFMDLMALKKIQPDTVVEKFSGMINSSFFDASNILGTLKIKDLVDFTSAIIGQNSITVTEKGKKVLADANSKASESVDQLDHTLLVQLSSGKRSLNDISGAVNIRPMDLAMHLYKLEVQQYITTTFRNGNLDLLLTEKGFSQSKAELPNLSQQPNAAQAPVTVRQPAQQPGPSQSPQTKQFTSPTVKLPGPNASQQPSSPAQPAKAGIPEDLSKVGPRKSRAPKIIIATIIILLILIVLAYLNII